MRSVAIATTRSGTRTIATTSAMTGGVVVGVVGAAVVAGVIAAAAKRERETRERADYCMNRYGNYDRRTDSYRDRDGYTYPCR